MKKLILLLTLLSAVFNIRAQNAEMSISLREALAKSPQDELIPFMLSGSAEDIKTLTEKHNGKFKYSHGDICAIALPAYAVESFILNIPNRMCSVPM
jgi:hypothetical protein